MNGLTQYTGDLIVRRRNLSLEATHMGSIVRVPNNGFVIHYGNLRGGSLIEIT